MSVLSVENKEETLSEKIKKLLNPKDYKILYDFIDVKKNTSSGSARAYQSAIYRFLNFVNKSNIHEITIENAEDYFSFLNKSHTMIKNKETGDLEPKGLKKHSYKRTQLHLIHSFFDNYILKIRKDIPNYFNPIPTYKQYQFSPDKKLSSKERIKLREDSFFTPEQTIKILKELSFTFGKYIRVINTYLMIGTLLTFCGMRISECLSIKIADVDTSLRYLSTGIENNARKSTNKGHDDPLEFCFPEIVASMLSHYIHDLEEEYPKKINDKGEEEEGTIWLFPGMNPKNHISKRTIMYVFERLKLPFSVKSHSFRRSIETHQLNLVNRIPLNIVEMLSHHRNSSTVMNNYNIVTIEERLKTYDDCLPKEYLEIIDFLENL